MESERKAPELYKEYMTAQFEEWFRLVPQLEEQNRKVYATWMEEYTRKKLNIST